MMLQPNDALKLGLGFLNAFAGSLVLIPDLGNVEKGVCAALVAACGFGLLFLDRLGTAKKSKTTIDVNELTVGQRRRLLAQLTEVQS